jgi:hypothetical protein
MNRIDPTRRQAIGERGRKTAAIPPREGEHEVIIYKRAD